MTTQLEKWRPVIVPRSFEELVVLFFSDRPFVLGRFSNYFLSDYIEPGVERVRVKRCAAERARFARPR